MFWFVRTLLSNARRKFKYYIVYLSSLFLIYCILTRVINIYSVKPKSYVNLKHVVVHIDLKGSPPKMTYLVSLLPILSMYGVNAILLEYEDMFPYINNIANISSVNAYTRTELLTFINTAKTLEMEIIPLIQTFGHMEYVLKLEQFAHLREQKTIPKDICPSNPESRKLITTMLQQVFDLHAFIQPLDHIHIGCDEVGNINVCPKCKERKLKSTFLFADHVKEVSSIIQDIIPDTKVLIWGDMLLELRKPLTNYFFNVDAVSWEYGAYPKFSHIYFYNLHKSFNNIWIASAYKGADGKNATIPDIKKRFQNHLSWMKFILDYKFGGEKRVHTFEGIILTGWSRYNHQDPQCELLPIAMPSLILNLLLIKTLEKGIDHGDLDLHYCDFYKKYLDKDFSYIFQNHGNTDKKCAFENTFLYEEHEKLFNHTLIHNCLHILHLRETECRSIDSNVDLKSTFKHCKKALTKLMKLKSSLEKFMIKYYKIPIIKSYIDDVVEAPVNKIRKKMKYVKQNCHKNLLQNRGN